MARSNISQLQSHQIDQRPIRLDFARLPGIVVVLLLAAAAVPPATDAAAKPCAIPSSPIVIPVRKESDFLLRLRQPARTVVTLSLTASLRLSKTLYLGANFSCTILRAAAPRKVTLTAPNVNNPALRIQDTNNVLVHGINFRIPVSDANMPQCYHPNTKPEDYMDKWSCPAVFVYNVWAVQVTQGNVFGRIDIYRAFYSRIDNMDVRVNAANRPGAILAAYMGDGPNLIRAQVWITNNRLRTLGKLGSGALVGLMIFRGAVGVIANNNKIMQFTLASLQMGYGMTNTGDAMLNVAAGNEIIHNFGQIGAGTPMDVAGIYMGTHWVNPGNVLRCNYVEEGGHCLYLDWCASGTYVDGLVCLRTADGLKLNTGKNNVVRGMIVIDSLEPANGYISCQNYDQNNCDVGTGKKWAESLNKDYQTPRIRKVFPFLTNFCKKTVINGINCNAGTTRDYSAAKTGRCSGLPTQNHAQIASVTSPGDKMDRMVFYQDNCKPFPAVPKLNTLISMKTTTAAARFINLGRRNLGLLPGSSIQRAFKQFRSCPAALVGPKPLGFQGYMNLFNIARPPMRPVLVRPLSADAGAGTAARTAAGAAAASVKRTDPSAAIAFAYSGLSGGAGGGGEGGLGRVFHAHNPYARPSAKMISEMQKGRQ